VHDSAGGGDDLFGRWHHSVTANIAGVPAGARDACQFGIGGNEQGNGRHAKRGGKVNESGIHATDKIGACKE
jgi:hypothetical protein